MEPLNRGGKSSAGCRLAGSRPRVWRKRNRCRARVPAWWGPRRYPPSDLLSGVPPTVLSVESGPRIHAVAVSSVRQFRACDKIDRTTLVPVILFIIIFCFLLLLLILNIITYVRSYLPYARVFFGLIVARQSSPSSVRSCRRSSRAQTRVRPPPDAESTSRRVSVGRTHLPRVFRDPFGPLIIRILRRPVFAMDFSNKTENDNLPLSDEVLEVLESQFNKVKTLHSTDLEIIAAELGVRDIDVKVWYTNRLAAWRRSQGLSDCFGQL